MHYKFRRVIDIVLDYYGIKEHNLMSKQRTQRCVSARFMCYWYLRQIYGLSFSEIGKFFGRDHTTVINGMRVIEDSIKTKMHLYSDIQRLNLVMFPESDEYTSVMVQFSGSVQDFIKAIKKTGFEIINYQVV